MKLVNTLATSVAAVCLAFSMIGCESTSDTSSSLSPGAVAECGTNCESACCGASCEKDAAYGAISESDCSSSCSDAAAKCSGAADANLGAVSSEDCASKCSGAADANLGAVGASDCSEAKTCPFSGK